MPKTSAMRVLRKILPGILLLALLYGAFLFVEHLTAQELTRVSHPQTQETVCLMWKPRLLRGGGVCDLNLLNAQGKVVDTARLGILNAGFDALQQFGQLGFEGQSISVANLQTGELVRRFVVRNGRLTPPE